MTHLVPLPHRIQAAVLFLVLLALLAMAMRASAAEALRALPSAEVEALDGSALTVPDTFAGDHNLVVMSFARDQADALDAWYESGGALPGVTPYRLLLMGGVPRPVRGIVERAMRRAVPDATHQGRYLLHYGDGDAYLEQLGLADTSEVLVLLVDRGGQVRWTHRGPVDDDALAALRAAL